MPAYLLGQIILQILHNYFSIFVWADNFTAKLTAQPPIKLLLNSMLLKTLNVTLVYLENVNPFYTKSY